MPIWIRIPSARRLAGTVIEASRGTVAGVKAISARRGIVLVSMETIGMWQQVGFLADVFERFKRHGLSVDLIGSSETNVTVSLDPSDNLVTTNVLDALCARSRADLPGEGDRAVQRGHPGRPRHALAAARLTDVWSEFGRDRVHLISQSSNDLNLTFVVDEALAEGLLPRLHEMLIQAERACRSTTAKCSGPAGVARRADRDAPRPVPWWSRDGAPVARARSARHAALRLSTCRGADRARRLRARLPAVDRGSTR